MQYTDIEESLKKHIHEQNTVFVFPSQISAEMWADRATLITDTSAVAMERFIAWDDFKGSSIRSQQQDKQAIPSAMRQIFASHLINQNSQNPFLHSIIPEKYAHEAESFTDSIAALLPSLFQWKKHFEEKNLAPDEEDSDLLTIYNCYKDFLETHNCFDPAWETPPFKSNGNTYIIFYPEILMDWFEYKPILESSPDIQLIHLKDSAENSLEEHPSVSFYKNSRAEIRSVAQYLRKMHDEKKISWSCMALSIPDIQTYTPYIERELSLYEIPFVLKSGQPLASFGAGSFFAQAQQCVQTDFSFDSIKKLLLNKDLPWKEEELNLNLIKFGQDNNCLCSYTYNGKTVDVWEQAFNTQPQEELLSTYYESLKRTLKSFVKSESFSKIREEYFSFREKFFDMSLCSQQSDLIISRCITELGILIDLENEFPDCKVHSPFQFFTNSLSQKMYLAQNANTGVQILPYRLSATAPFSVQAILDSSQASLSILYKQLSFLRDDKRAKLGFTQDTDVSELFIRLYNRSAQDGILFTAAEKTFKGYSLCHSYLTEQNAVTEQDFYSNEKEWLLEKANSNGEKAQFPKELFSTQYDKDKGFDSWQLSQGECAAGASNIENKIFKPYKDEEISVSYSDLKKFFDCPRRFMFDKLLNIQPQNNEAELMDTFAMGNLYHSVLEFYCNFLKERNLKLQTTEEGLSEEYKDILCESIDKAIEKQNLSHLGKQLMITTRQAILSKMLSTVHEFSKLFNGYEVAESESSYTYEMPENNCTCKGRIDCLLKDTQEAEYILIDFKNSKRAIHNDIFYVSEDVDIPDFQMPMYLFLMENAPKNRQKKVENCAFFNITDEKLVPVTGFDTDIDFEPTQKRVQELISVYCERLRANDFSTDSERQDFYTCCNCTYKSVCRRTFNISREQ